MKKSTTATDLQLSRSQQTDKVTTTFNILIKKPNIDIDNKPIDEFEHKNTNSDTD